MEQVISERPFFEDPHIKQQRTSIDGTFGVVGAEFQDLSHGWYPKRQTGLSKTPIPMSFLGSNRPLQLEGPRGNSSHQTEYQHHKPGGHNGSKLFACRHFIQGKCTYGASCKFQHSNKDGDAVMKIVSTPGESEKTEAMKTDSRKRKRRRSKHLADAKKKETTDPATQSASKISSEAEIGQGDVLKQVEQDGKGLVMETCEISTSAGKNTINAEVIVSDSTVSCEKNHISSVVNVLNKDGDAELKVVSTPGESDKTEAVTKNSRKRKRKRAKRLADAMKKESIDPATQSASKSLGGCLDSSIPILNQRSEAEIGQGDVMKEGKQDGEGFVIETCAVSTSAGKIAVNAEVFVSDSTVSCENNHTLPVVSVLSKDGDAEMKIVSTPGENEKTEAVKAKSRKSKRKFAKRLADAVKKETFNPATQSASESAGCSILDQRSEAEVGQGDVMKEVKQDGEGFVMETCAVSTSAGKIAVNAEVFASDSTVSCEKNHTLPVVSVLSKDSDAEMKIVSTPGENEKTETVKAKSRKSKRKCAKRLADAVKKETIDPATQGASESAGCSILNQRSEAEIGQGDVMKEVNQDGEGFVMETCAVSTSAGKIAVNAEVIVSDSTVSCEKNHTSPVVSVLSKDSDAEMKIVSTPGENEKTEAVKDKSRKRKRKCAKRLADAVKKETIDPATQGASKSASGSILNQRSEAEIGQGDLMKQLKQDVEGLVIETCEISTSAGKSVVNAEVIVSDSAVSCEKNHTSPAVSVLNKDGDVEMKIVSITGESEKTDAVKTNSRKKKKRCSKRCAAAMKKETTDPATQSASKIPLNSLDSSISILNHRSEPEIGPGDVMRQVKQDGKELVIIETGETSSAGKNSINAVVVSDSAISCENNHTSPVVSVLNEDSDLGGSEKTEAVKTKSRKRKTKRSKCPVATMEKETTDPATQSASKSLGGCLDSSISVLNPRSEAEILQGDIVMEQIKQDGEGLVTETCEISTSGNNAINAEVIVSDSTVSCEKSHHDFSVTGAPADLSIIDHPVQQHEQKNEVLTSDIQNNNQPTSPVLQDEPVRIDDSGCCSMQTSDSLSRTPTLVSKRKLLVLDMNGLLVDVTWTTSRGPKPDIMVSKKGVFKRPFCDDFLKFCFERFDVGVWSSRVRVNLDQIVDFVMGDSRKRLLFCWDQSHCTRTGHNTLENRCKPLVLKELSKLWEKQVKDLPWEIGYYNETNTVLLDDSPYKALRNPPNTAIFVHPYSCTMVGDRSLGPDGDLRKYLIRLSEAENVQKFIEENPFGQDPITRSSKQWGFYCRIAKPSGGALCGKKGI